MLWAMAIRNPAVDGKKGRLEDEESPTDGPLRRTGRGRPAARGGQFWIRVVAAGNIPGPRRPIRTLPIDGCRP